MDLCGDDDLALTMVVEAIDPAEQVPLRGVAGWQSGGWDCDAASARREEMVSGWSGPNTFSVMARARSKEGRPVLAGLHHVYQRAA